MNGFCFVTAAGFISEVKFLIRVRAIVNAKYAECRGSIIKIDLDVMWQLHHKYLKLKTTSWA